MKLWITGIVFLIIVSLPVEGYSFDRKVLIFCSESEGVDIHILELKSTGQITTTGQTINTGATSLSVGVSPDQRFVWTIFSDTTYSVGLKQYSASPYGLVSVTGRIIPLPEAPGDIRFTPNGQLLLLGGGPVFYAYPDGSIQSTGNIYSAPGGNLFISPRGDINAVRVNNYRRVDKIDYNTYSAYSLQQFPATGGTIMDGAVYTPNGDYIAMAIGGGTNVNDGFEIYHVLSNGTLDTTSSQIFGTGGSNGYLDINRSGTHIYVGISDSRGNPGIRRFDWYSIDTPFIDSGVLTPLSDLWQIKVSPDGNILMAAYTDNSSYPTKEYLKTFFIQADGNLVDTGYSFPFTDTFGDYIADLQFVYPPAPTNIPPELWGKLE